MTVNQDAGKECLENAILVISCGVGNLEQSTFQRVPFPIPIFLVSHFNRKTVLSMSQYWYEIRC